MRLFVSGLLTLALALPIFADDAKLRRDRDAAAAIAVQLALDDTPAVREAAPMPKSDARKERDAAAIKAIEAVLNKSASISEILKVNAPGWHIHECLNGHQWSHSNANVGDVNAHTCPACGLLSWEPKELGKKFIERKVTPKPEPVETTDENYPVDGYPLPCDEDDELFGVSEEFEPIGFFEAAPPCPNGQCPNTTSRTVTRTYSGPVTVAKTAVKAAPVAVSRSVTVVQMGRRHPVANAMSYFASHRPRLLFRR